MKLDTILLVIYGLVAAIVVPIFYVMLKFMLYMARDGWGIICHDAGLV